MPPPRRCDRAGRCAPSFRSLRAASRSPARHPHVLARTRRLQRHAAPEEAGDQARPPHPPGRRARGLRRHARRAPEPVEIVAANDDDAAPLDLILFFTDSEDVLRARFDALAASLTPAGMLWIGWPKKASKVPTDLTEDVVRRIALERGMVDVKVCAIDATWSGLKLVYRLVDRPRR
jgi:hypothetical protein